MWWRFFLDMSGRKAKWENWGVGMLAWGFIIGFRGVTENRFWLGEDGQVNEQTLHSLRKECTSRELKQSLHLIIYKWWHDNRFEVNWPPEPTLVLRWISKFFLVGALPSDTLKIKHTKDLKEIPSRHVLENLLEKSKHSCLYTSWRF